VLYVTRGAPGLISQGLRANGYGDHSPGHYGLLAALVSEVVLTMMFLFIIMGATHGKAPVGFAPIAIGLGLTLIHLVGIPVTNLSVNPARSTGPALFVGGWALGQLWLFWVAPLVGGMLGGLLYHWLSQRPSAQVTGLAAGAPISQGCTRTLGDAVAALDARLPGQVAKTGVIRDRRKADPGPTPVGQHTIGKDQPAREHGLRE
jgi:hypothetical protein